MVGFGPLRSLVARLAGDAFGGQSPVTTAQSLGEISIASPSPLVGLLPTSLGSELDLEPFPASASPTSAPIDKTTTTQSPSVTRNLRNIATYNSAGRACDATFGALDALNLQVQILLFGLFGNYSDFGMLHVAACSDTLQKEFSQFHTFMVADATAEANAVALLWAGTKERGEAKRSESKAAVEQLSAQELRNKYLASEEAAITTDLNKTSKAMFECDDGEEGEGRMDVLHSSLMLSSDGVPDDEEAEDLRDLILRDDALKITTHTVAAIGVSLESVQVGSLSSIMFQSGMAFNAVKPLEPSVIGTVIEHCPLIYASLQALVIPMATLIETTLEMLFRKRLDVDLCKTTSRTNWSTHYITRPLTEPALGKGPYVLVAQKLVAKPDLTSKDNIELVTKLLAANDRAIALLGGNK